VNAIRPRSRRARLRGSLTILAFILPALALFCMLVLTPIIVGFYTSLFKWNGLGGLPRDFVGLDNYTRLFADPVFYGDLWHTGVLVVLSLVIQLPLALGIALLLNQRLRGRAFYRVVFFAPYVLSEAITAVLFMLILSPSVGLANQILGIVGLDGLEWFADQSTVLLSLFLVITWKYFGLHMILYLTGRQAIPREIIEAAQIDGGNAWQVFRRVTPAAARADDPHQHLPLGHRDHPALRPGVDHHGGRPVACVGNAGRHDVPVRFQALPGGLRERDQRGDVPAEPRVRARLPALRDAPRP